MCGKCSSGHETAACCGQRALSQRTIEDALRDGGFTDRDLSSLLRCNMSEDAIRVAMAKLLAEVRAYGIRMPAPTDVSLFAPAEQAA